MKPRVEYTRISRDGFNALRKLDEYVRESGLEPSLLELVKLRASQLNRCAYCVDLHARAARSGGENERRLHATPVWQETPFFSDRERAALAWTEATTLISRGAIHETSVERMLECFTEKELVDLTLAIAAINSWNRIAIAFRPPISHVTVDDRAKNAAAHNGKARG